MIRQHQSLHLQVRLPRRRTTERMWSIVRHRPTHYSSKSLPTRRPIALSALQVYRDGGVLPEAVLLPVRQLCRRSGFPLRRRHRPSNSRLPMPTPACGVPPLRPLIVGERSGLKPPQQSGEYLEKDRVTPSLRQNRLFSSRLLALQLGPPRALLLPK